MICFEIQKVIKEQKRKKLKKENTRKNKRIIERKKGTEREIKESKNRKVIKTLIFRLSFSYIFHTFLIHTYTKL